MRVSCSVPREGSWIGLPEEIRGIGIEPIITSQVVRAVYEGHDARVGLALAGIFRTQPGSEVILDEDPKKEKKPRELRPRPTPKRKRHAKKGGRKK